MHKCIVRLSHTIHHQHVAVTFMTIFRVTYKNIRNPNDLSKCTREPLNVRRISSTFYTVTEY